MNNTHVYCISGLGLDERLFLKTNIRAKRVNYIKWIDPLPHETIEDYARRMLNQVHDEGNIVLIGVSFGGMMAIEMAKLKRIEQVILISSIKQKKELPPFFRLMRKIPLYPLFNQKWRERTKFFWRTFFGLKTEEAKYFFDEMLATTSEKYKIWAIDRMIKWKNTDYPSNLVHIQGTKDLIFPHKYISNPILVKNGTHGMIVSHAAEVNTIINQILVEKVKSHKNL